MSRDNQSERIRAFRSDVIRERYRIPCWSLPLHGLWTAVVMNVVLWVLLIALFAGFELLYVLFTLFDVRRLNLRTIVDTYGIITVMIAGIFAAATLPACVIGALINARPKLILAGRGKLLVRYRRKTIQAPLSECQWKPGHVWSMDNVGALWRREPYLVLIWTPIQLPGKSQPYSRTVFVGLTASTYRQWLKLIVRERILRYSSNASLSVVMGILSGGFLGRLLGAAADPVLRLAFGPNLAFGIDVLLVIDGLAMGGISSYVAYGELRRARAYVDFEIQSPRLIMAVCFAGIAAKLFLGLGAKSLVVMVVLNGFVGFMFGRNLQRIIEKRIHHQQAAAHVSSLEVSVEER